MLLSSLVFLPLLLIFPLILPNRLFAESYQITAKGSKSFELEPTSKNATFWYYSKGNNSSTLDLSLNAPRNSVVTVELAKGKVSPATVGSFWQKLNIHNGSKLVKEFTVNGSSFSPGTPDQGEPLLDCSQFSEAVISSILLTYQSVYGSSFTLNDLCGDSERSGSTSSDSASSTIASAAATTFLSKDACDKRTKQYTVKISVKIPSSLTGVAKITLSANERFYSGAKASSIKPISDGRFAPRPLVLMSSLGGSEKIELVKWSGKKIQSRKPLKSAKYTAYRSFFLLSALLDNVLRGGYGTFEISNSSNQYGVCFQLKRVRQRANGYTN
jgi:hypothetical protein